MSRIFPHKEEHENQDARLPLRPVSNTDRYPTRIVDLPNPIPSIQRALNPRTLLAHGSRRDGSIRIGRRCGDSCGLGVLPRQREDPGEGDGKGQQVSESTCSEVRPRQV